MFQRYIRSLTLVIVGFTCFMLLLGGVTQEAFAASLLPKRQAARASASDIHVPPNLGTRCGPAISWTLFQDTGGHHGYYTPSNGGSYCAYADWYFTEPTATCTIYAYILASHNTATAFYGYWDSLGNKYYGTIDQSKYHDEWVALSVGYTDIIHVNLGDNNNTGTGQISVGEFWNDSLWIHCE